VNWLKRLFTKKHQVSVSRKTTYRDDACPVPEGYVELLGLRFNESEAKPRVKRRP